MIDFGKLKPHWREVLGRIAINDDRFVNNRTADALVKRGLIESYKENLGGRLPVVITRYRMPLDIHIQWCSWCAENFTLEEMEAEDG